MTSTGGMDYYRPELLGKYELQYKLANNRLVYRNNDSLMYMYSAKQYDARQNGLWLVCNVLFKCYYHEFILIKTLRNYHYELSI